MSGQVNSINAHELRLVINTIEGDDTQGMAFGRMPFAQ